MEHLKQLIRTIPDFPKRGIEFRDLTTLFLDAKGFSEVIQRLADHYRKEAIDVIVGIESRGFVLGAPLAIALGKGFVPVRKPGKLPGAKVGVEYSLEYGTDRLEMHTDAVKKGAKVLMVDDLLATGGTMEAACRLVEQVGGKVVSCAFVVELPALHGRKRIAKYPVHCMLEFEGD
ncbi:MAG TPA: adenine phosphoribosyltransferase [bacterium]